MKAAMYLRSSKDRSDVSLDVQRRELAKLAASRSLTVAKIYEDAVESGATEDRPGFIELVRALKHPSRGWDYLLVYDTSRIARRRYIAQAIKHEAKKRGVIILYARIPSDLDPVAELVLESVFEAMDEAHSIMSRQKGLAGMAENVRRGFRAGGRAPIGYELKALTTGTIREGSPVMKSKLVLGAKGAMIGEYLKARAIGVPRTIAARKTKMPATSLIGVEWNALTYAGHTVWNRHAPNGGGTKMRPRSAWQVTRGTHEALISDVEAETILARLETSDVGRSVSQAMAAKSDYLLTGLLYTGDGQMWIAHGKYYRLKRRDNVPGKTVPAAMVESAVLEQVKSGMKSDLFLRNLLASAQRSRRTTDPAAAIDRQIAKLEKERGRAAHLALTSDADTFTAIVEERSRHIESLRREANAVRQDDTISKRFAGMTVAGLKGLLGDQSPEKALQTLVDRIVLERDLTCQIELKAVPGRQRRWPGVASPQVRDSWPPELIQRVTLKRSAGWSA
jgi:site-specific DNA recombinase